MSEGRPGRSSRGARTLAWHAAALLLTAVLPGCMQPASQPPSALDVSLDRPTQAGIYQVGLAPPVPPPRVNQIHSWHITLHDRHGQPVPNAQITIDGGMPEHGHGFPTRPRVASGTQAGQYLLEGMKFNMVGWWQIKLDVKSPLGADAVTFNTVLPPSAQ